MSEPNDIPEPLYPDWRAEELTRKYAAKDAYEPDEVEE